MNLRWILFLLLIGVVPIILFFSATTRRRLCSVDLPSLVCSRPADKVTFGIKSFGRPDVALRLAKSIRSQGYTSPILVVDDGHNNSAHKFSRVSNLLYFKMDFDVGLSAGRNFAVEHTKTPYYMTLDDDFVFTRHTDVDKLVELLEARNLDFVSGRLGTSSVGYFAEQENELLYCVDEMDRMEKIEGTDCVYTQRTTNFFVAKHSFLTKHPWRNELKLVEHSVFFAEAYRAGARGAHCPSVRAAHKRPNSDDEYSVHRGGWSVYLPLIAEILGKPMREDCVPLHAIQVTLISLEQDRLFLPADTIRHSANPVSPTARWTLPDVYRAAILLRPAHSLLIDLGYSATRNVVGLFKSGYDVLGLAVAGEKLSTAKEAMQAAHAQHPELTNYGEGVFRLTRSSRLRRRNKLAGNSISARGL